MAGGQKETDRLIEHLSVIEEAAEDILSDKQQIIEFDLRRNKTREALRSLQKSNMEKKSWICIGDMFIKMPKTTAVKMLEKDYDELEKEINETRSKLKPKVNKLRDLQNEDDIKGFALEPLSQSEYFWRLTPDNILSTGRTSSNVVLCDGINTNKGH